MANPKTQQAQPGQQQPPAQKEQKRSGFSALFHKEYDAIEQKEIRRQAVLLEERENLLKRLAEAINAKKLKLDEHEQGLAKKDLAIRDRLVELTKKEELIEKEVKALVQKQIEAEKKRNEIAKEMERQVKDFQKKKTSLQSEILAEAQDYEKRKKVMEQQFLKYSQEMEGRKKGLNDSLTQILAYKEKVSQEAVAERQNLKLLHEQYDKLQREHAAREKDLVARDQKLTALQTRLAQDSEKLKEEAQKVQQNKDALMSLSQQLSAKQQTMDEALKLLEKRQMELTGQITDLSNKKQSLEADIAAEKADLARIIQEYNDRRAELEENRRLVQQRPAIEKMLDQNERIKNAMDKKELAIADQIKKLDEQKKAMEEEMVLWKQAKAESEAQLKKDKLEHESNVKQAKIEHEAAVKARLKSLAEEEKARLKQLEDMKKAIIDEEKSRMKALEDAKKSLLAEERKRLLSVSQHEKESEKRLKAMEKELSDRIKAVQATQKEMQQRSAKIAQAKDYKANIQHLKTQWLKMQKQIKSAEEDVQRIHAEKEFEHRVVEEIIRRRDAMKQSSDYSYVNALQKEPALGVPKPVYMPEPPRMHEPEEAPAVDLAKYQEPIQAPPRPVYTPPSQEIATQVPAQQPLPFPSANVQDMMATPRVELPPVGMPVQEPQGRVGPIDQQARQQIPVATSSGAPVSPSDDKDRYYDLFMGKASARLKQEHPEYSDAQVNEEAKRLWNKYRQTA